VVLYEHSSAARDVLKKILAALGAEILSYERSDTFIPVDTEAFGDLSRFKEVITGYSAMAFVSTDGDRPMLLDENGTVVRGDQIGVLSAMAIQADGVVTPLSSSTALEKSGPFKKILRTKIGSPYVAEGMQSLIADGAKRVIGFEANGGVLLGADLHDGHSGDLSQLMTRDSVLPLLLVLKEAVSQRQSLSKLVARLPQRFTASELIREFAPEKGSALLKRFSLGGTPFFTEAWGKDLGNAVHLDEMDGVRVEFASGAILHFRQSGNAPEFRIYSETQSLESAVELAKKAMQWIPTLGA
jgi:phosphomannomutase